LSGYLVGVDGPHAGVTISFEDGDEWLLGRDPDLCYFVLEDPMVSRRHALIRRNGDHFLLENISSVNPVQVNNEAISAPYELQEDDSVQVGNNYFRFTQVYPQENTFSPNPLKTDDYKETETDAVEKHLRKLPFITSSDSRWMIKVISGPNQGAEFGMNLSETHIIGKDPMVSDIIFQDSSVSRQHAKLDLSSLGSVHIEDLGSRNGILVNGSRVEGTQEIYSEDLITMGTTSFLVIDREANQETIYSPSKISLNSDFGKPSSKEEPSKAPDLTQAEEEKNWKDTFIPTRHLIVASLFSLMIFAGVISFLALFRTQTVVVHHRDESKEIREAIGHFSSIQFSFNPSNGRIFLVGHVLTDVEHSELIYLIYNLPFITSVEDNVVVDEGVWSSLNGLLMKNPNWRGVSLTSKKAGSFVLKGYVNTEDEAIALRDYINMNFSYLNLLENQVVVENTLQTQLQNLLIEKNFLNVSFQLNNGEVIFAGRVNMTQESMFESLLDEIEKIRGVQQIKNFVIFTGASTARIDLSSQYTISGTSRLGAISEYVLINGKILTKGDALDGMTITGITSDEVQLDKDGIKYKIDYNNQ
jgi:type III secretion system YscD/HrpQ family protein